MSENRNRYIKKKIEHNKAVKENIDSLNTERNKFKSQVKKGAEEIGSSLIPKASKSSGDDRYKQMLSNMDARYKDKLDKMAKQFDALSNYTQRTLGDTRKGMSQMEKSNAMLRKEMSENQDKTYKALTSMQKYLDAKTKASSGNSGNTRGTRSGGGPADPLAAFNTYTAPTNPKLITKKPKAEEVSKEAEKVDDAETTTNTTTNTTDTTTNTTTNTTDKDIAKSFITALEMVHENEGAYQEQKADKGNYNSNGQLVGTNKGISAPIYEDWIGHPPSKEEMKAISKETADKIYKDVFWDGIHGDEIKDPQVAMIIFDHGVNASVKNGIRVAQRTLKAMGYNITVDGKMVTGGETLEALNKVDSKEFFNNYKKQRIIYYNNLSEDKKRHYLKGWINRVNKFNYK